MKRERYNRFKGAAGRNVLIYPFWNLLFWKECHKCGLDFVRERGWVYDETFDGRLDRHVCAECCKTAKEVADYFFGWDAQQLGNRPLPPPAPPRQMRFHGPCNCKVL